MNLKEIAERDIKMLRGKSGIYWTMSQPDKSGEEDILVDHAKNFSVQNMYNYLANSLKAVTGATITEQLPNVVGIGGGGIGGYINSSLTTIGINSSVPCVSIVQSNSNGGVATIKCRAGTDTVTPSTLSMADIVTPASPTPSSSSCVLSEATGGLQWVVQWGIGAFGASGTTQIGEFGLVLQDVYIAMFNRLAVADNNAGFTAPVTVNNTVAYNATITLVI